MVCLPDTLAELDVKTLNNTLLQVKAEELLHALADKLEEVEAETLSHTLAEVIAKNLFDNLVD